MTGRGVPWPAWEPVYEAIIADFGFSRVADEAARDQLGALLGDGACRLEDLPASDGRTVAIAGAGPSLADETDVASAADRVFAASTASETLREAGVAIDVHVTDLDKDEEVVRELSADDVPIAVHAHGDNREALGRLVPQLDPATVFPTTQAEPTERVANPGGFTDGDRAAFLADALGADRLLFPGWDLDDPAVSEVKRRKLAWAARLLRWLESRRGERFAVLDGRRDETPMPPGVEASRGD